MSAMRSIIATTTMLLLIVIPIVATTGAASDTNTTTTIQLVSMERAVSVLNTVNDTILFVDVQIAIAERARLSVVDAVAQLSSARVTLKDARLAFDGGDYVGAVDMASQASTKAQHALVLVPQPPPQVAQASGMNFQQAKSMLESANGTILFVDESIAEAEKARKNVIAPVEKLAEARGLFRQASSAFNEGNYQSSYKSSSEAMTLAQESLAVLSQAPPPTSFINPKNLTIMAGALLLILLVVYFRIKSGELRATSTQYVSSPPPMLRPLYYYPTSYQYQNRPSATQYHYQPQSGPVLYPSRQYSPVPPVTTAAVAAGTLQQYQAKKVVPGQGQAR